EPRPVTGSHNQPVDDNGNVVVLPAVQCGYRSEVVDLAAHSHPNEPTLAYIFQHVPEFALAASHHRREHLDPALLRPAQHRIRNLTCTLTGHRSPVIGTVGHADPGPEQSEVIVDLGDRADG